jgi:hypothetical protein
LAAGAGFRVPAARFATRVAARRTARPADAACRRVPATARRTRRPAPSAPAAAAAAASPAIARAALPTVPAACAVASAARSAVSAARSAASAAVDAMLSAVPTTILVALPMMLPTSSADRASGSSPDCAAVSRSSAMWCS